MPGDELLEISPLEIAQPESSLTAPYEIKLEIFEGPLDLLLFLIKKEQVSIYDIPIARITEQYLDYLRMMQELDIATASEFLVMATTLIYIKSKMLLPPDPLTDGLEEAEDPRRQLVERLIEYQKYKAAAEMLWSRAEVEQGVFTRGLLETDEANPEIAVTVFDLFETFLRVVERLKERHEIAIAREEITMAEKLAEIQTFLNASDRIDVTLLFESARTLRELLIIFLAVLELVKQAVIGLVQTERFGRIAAVRLGERAIT